MNKGRLRSAVVAALAVYCCAIASCANPFIAAILPEKKKQATGELASTVMPITLPADDAAPIASGITISQTGNGYPLTADLEVTGGGYTGAAYYYGSVKLADGWLLELDAANSLYNVPGTHNITLVVYKDGAPYSYTITFTVTP